MKKQERPYLLSKPIQATFDAEGVIEYCTEDSQRAMICFRQYSDRKVRLACIEIVKNGMGIYNLTPLAIQWVQQTIRDLDAVNDAEMAERLVKLYGEQVKRKVVDFTAAFSDPANRPSDFLQCQGPVMCNEIEKLARFMVSLTETPYTLMSAACKTLCGLEEAFFDAHITAPMDYAYACFADALRLLEVPYAESRWHSAQQVIRLLLKVGQFDFIELLQRLVDLHEAGTTGPDVPEPELMTAANLGVLKKALVMMEDRKSKAKTPVNPHRAFRQMQRHMPNIR